MPPSNVLPDATKIDLHVPVPRGSIIPKLRSEAESCGGACTKVFKQEGMPDEAYGKKGTPQLGLARWYKNPVVNKLQQLNGLQEIGGVCQALSAYWIAYHANDRDFWDWLAKGGFIQGDAATMIVAGQMHSYGDQLRWERNTLTRFGVVQQSGGQPMTDLSQLGAELRGHIVGRAIAPGEARWGYRSIGLYNPTGHAMAAWVGKDVAFFDPSWGEYWFETRAGFRKWFREYWRMTARGQNYLHKAYDINLYGKSIR